MPPGKWQLLIFLGQQTILNIQKNGNCCTGAERLSIEPWNTTTDGYADCEDMPRKSVDKKFPDDPVQQKRGNCTLFLPSGEREDRAMPDNGSRDWSLVGC